MFTGIVEEIGSVKKVVQGEKSIKLSINCDKVLKDTRIGDSIAVNGICLTATNIGEGWFEADVMPETMRKTGLATLITGRPVNLERALRLSDRLGGHIVSGHIDGTGVVAALVREDNAIWVTINAGSEIMKYVVMKGSIALDGTSLTVAFVDDKTFKVSLIPLTASETALGSKKVGDIVNIECDVIGKYVERLLVTVLEKQSGKGDISMEFLRENGFV